ncbi:MAG: DNA primase [Oscillospiraceae bacterium]|jgi:DNA primase
MALSEDFLYQLKAANSIDSIMSDYATLKKQGRNYVCLCPFHSEKSPSCTVYTDTESFYCFGCGAGGDVITFIMKIENLDYIEAVRFLAQRAGITMPEDGFDDKTARLKQRIYEINRAAAKFFFSNLKRPEGEKGLKYFLERGLLPETIQKYGLGFSHDSWVALKNHLLAENFSEDELIAAGLCLKSKSGSVFDIFRNRVIFPIIDLRGNVIAFGGRILEGDGPKYLNSSDTPVFKKSRNLFSLNFAKSCKENRLILAEGYMDVIAVNQAGFSNVVATLGTALTPEQARLMAQYAEEIIISYDSDEAGQKAAHRAISILSEVGLRTKVLKIPDAKDPDEYIKKFGSVRFKLLLDNSEGAISFELDKCRVSLDMDSDIGKVEYLKKASAVLADIPNRIEREVYASRVANEQNISPQIIISEINAIIAGRRKSRQKKEWRNITLFSEEKHDKINPEAAQFPKEAKAEAGIIAYILQNPDEANVLLKMLPAERFVTSFNKKVYEFMDFRHKNALGLNISAFNSEFSPDEMGKISEMLARAKLFPITKKSALDYIDVLMSHIVNSTGENGEMSDDDFLDFVNNLKHKK